MQACWLSCMHFNLSFCSHRFHQVRKHIRCPRSMCSQRPCPAFLAHDLPHQSAANCCIQTNDTDSTVGRGPLHHRRGLALEGAAGGAACGARLAGRVAWRDATRCWYAAVKNAVLYWLWFLARCANAMTLLTNSLFLVLGFRKSTQVSCARTRGSGQGALCLASQPGALS